MAKQSIDTSVEAADTLPDGAAKLNANFDEVYAFLGDGDGLLAANARSSLGLGTAALSDSGDFATAAHVHGTATGANNGFLSAADKLKLDGIEAGATAGSGYTTLAELNIDLTDATLDDAGASRTPTAHAASHASGGGDPITPAAIGAATDAQGALADSAVQPARTLTAGTGLDGGGDLSADRTFNLDAATIASLALADSAVQSVDIQTIVKLTQAAYDALSPPDANTLYLIVEAS